MSPEEGMLVALAAGLDKINQAAQPVQVLDSQQYPCCPSCKSTDIWENNVEHVRLQVTAWGPADLSGDLEPYDFGERTTIDDTIRTVFENEAPRWYCYACGEETDVLQYGPDHLRRTPEGGGSIEKT